MIDEMMACDQWHVANDDLLQPKARCTLYLPYVFTTLKAHDRITEVGQGLRRVGLAALSSPLLFFSPSAQFGFFCGGNRGR